MTREQIESIINEFFQENNIQENYVRVTLKNGTIYNGFKIIVNNPTYLIGLQEYRRNYDVNDVFDCLSINKNQIDDFFNPNQSEI